MNHFLIIKETKYKSDFEGQTPLKSPELFFNHLAPLG